MPKEKSAGAIIFRKEGGKIYYLLLHYESGHWDFPKGHVEKGETDKEAALREIKEETGIEEVNFIDNFEEKIDYFFTKKKNNKKMTVFKEVIFYLAETKTKEIKISFEHLGFKWLIYNRAIEETTFKNAKKILKRANEFLAANRI